MDIVTYALCKKMIDEMNIDASIFSVKGSVNSFEDLPLTDNQNGDVYLVGPDSNSGYEEYYWLESANKWELLGSTAAGLADAYSVEVDESNGVLKMYRMGPGDEAFYIETKDEENSLVFHRINAIGDSISVSKDYIDQVINQSEASTKRYVDETIENTQAVYDANENGIVDNSEKVNNYTVETNVPANAKFTDTVPNIKTTTSTTSGDVYDVTYINTMIGDVESLLGGI